MQSVSRKHELAFGRRGAAETEKPDFAVRNLRLKSGEDPGGLERRGRSFDAQRRIGNCRRPQPGRRTAQFRGRKDTAHAGRGRPANKRRRVHLGEGRAPRRQIAGDNFVGTGRDRHTGRQCQERDHRARLFTCWYMLSAACTTLEFAS